LLGGLNPGAPPAGDRDRTRQGDARRVLERRLLTAVCRIYDARFPNPLRRRLAATGLTIFNDCITREAFWRALPLIDLRLICNEGEDFANPTEPSVHGGAKIAAAVVALTAEHDFARHRTACEEGNQASEDRGCPRHRSGAAMDLA
jgi:hypothetical protein